MTLHNLVCGVSTAALSRKTWLLQRGVLRLVSAAAAEQSLASSMGTAAAAAAAAARMRLETRLRETLETMGIIVFTWKPEIFSPLKKEIPFGNQHV